MKPLLVVAYNVDCLVHAALKVKESYDAVEAELQEQLRNGVQRHDPALETFDKELEALAEESARIVNKLKLILSDKVDLAERNRLRKAKLFRSKAGMLK